MGAVAKPVVQHLRLPLLSPEELKAVEEENKKDGLIPVSFRIHNSCNYQILFSAIVLSHVSVSSDPRRPNTMAALVALCTSCAVWSYIENHSSHILLQHHYSLLKYDIDILSHRDDELLSDCAAYPAFYFNKKVKKYRKFVSWSVRAIYNQMLSD